MLEDAAHEIAQRVIETSFEGRRLVALAGPPASGKSTLADKVAALVPRAQVVPMDGFHLDNAILDARGLRDRKGAPETFDAKGFVALVASLRDPGAITFPTFDRGLDCSVPGDGFVGAECETVIVEGNYLLLDAPGWRDLWAMWDLRVSLDVPLPVLRDRLIQRWLDHGLAPDVAALRAEGNDLRNARTVLEQSRQADISVTNI